MNEKSVGINNENSSIAGQNGHQRSIARALAPGALMLVVFKEVTLRIYCPDSMPYPVPFPD